MKQLLFYFFTLVFLITGTHIASATTKCTGYSDVDASIWYCPALEEMQAQGVLMKKDQFNPSGKFNRAEALKTLFLASGQDLTASRTQFFDIASDQWYSDYFQSAYALGLIQSENFKMNPANDISKSEYVILFMQIFNIEVTQSANCTLDGTPVVSSWLNITETQKMQYLCTAKELGVTKKFGGSFIDRATSMAVLYKGITGEDLN